VPRLRIVDVGTGSGCIAVALARWLPHAEVVATDASGDALDVARQNAVRHDVLARVRFVKSDLLGGVAGPFDAVVSNPPYVPAADIAGLQPEVRDYEPLQALTGGDDGLDMIRRLVPEAAAVLRPGGWLLFEFGFGQADAVTAVIRAEPRLNLAEIRDDLAGIPRVAVARKVESRVTP
jgi:release factor glutamine methyltransferase